MSDSASHGKLIVSEQRPEWLKPTLSVLHEVLTLPPNWNSYGANPIEPSAALTAISLLILVMNLSTPAPIITPTSQGRIELEWHTHGLDIEVTFPPGGGYELFYEDGGSGEQREIGPTHDVAALAEILNELTRRTAADAGRADR